MLNNVLDKKRNAHQNHGLTSFEKSQFLSTFLTCCFYSLERLVFFSQYFQTHFAELFCLYKKIPNFRLFLACSFYSLEKLFSFQKTLKHILLSYLADIKNMEKFPILDQNHRLSSSEKCQFFDFLNFLFLQPKQALFCSRIS